MLAWVDAKESPSSEAVKDLEGAVRRYEKVGARGGSASISLALLGECCVESGEIGTGLRVAELGLERVKQNKVRFLEAEFLRLRGELLMSGSPGTADEAALSLRKAYEIACSQKARALELRTLQSFVRAGIDREDGGDVRDSLRACYERFSEGFETADLRRTRALLTG